METLPKSIAKLVKSLQLKKYRTQEQLFLVEGAKNIEELHNSSYEIELITGSEEFISKFADSSIRTFIAKNSELSRLGSFQVNNAGIALARIPEPPVFNHEGFLLALDGISDPGNLGTIIRTADWFGFDRIVASPTTVDLYNPKVINSTMGSFTRVKVQYVDLSLFIKNYEGRVFAADMDGDNIQTCKIDPPSMMVMGSESHGISDAVLNSGVTRVTIPGYGSAESLNVGIATGIILNAMRNQ